MSSLTFLNKTGDVTLTWEDSGDAVMRRHINSMLNEGYSFFIIKESVFNKIGVGKSKTLEVKSINDIQNNHIKMEDSTASELLKRKNSNVQITNLKSGDIETTKRSTNAREISKSHTVATQPYRAG